MPEILLTVDEAADRLKIKPATLRSQLRAGRIASVRTGKMWRIPESALEPQPPRRDVAPIYPKANTPSAPEAPTRSELDALFAPSTPDEIARQLNALDKLTGAAKADAPELDLSGDRGELYGYAEREDRQR
jgi:excisionase family DNA binding protein